MRLFRAEALDVGVATSYGPIVLTRNWPSWVFATAGALVALAVCGYLVLGSYT